MNSTAEKIIKGFHDREIERFKATFKPHKDMDIDGFGFTMLSFMAGAAPEMPLKEAWEYVFKYRDELADIEYDLAEAYNNRRA